MTGFRTNRSISPRRSAAALFVGTAFIACLLPVSDAAAQAPDVPIESAKAIWEDDQVMERLDALCAAGTSLDVAEARKALRTPSPAKIEPLPQRTQELSGSDVARLARKSFLRLGWYGGEPGEEPGLYLGAAFAVDQDIFLTCRHVVAPMEIKAGCLAAIDLAGNVYPVDAVLASDRVSDTALVRVKGTGCEPLALSTDAAPGDRVYCFSEPLDAYGYFDEGIVNRFFRLPPPPRRQISEDAPALVRMHVSVDWAPGSSGAATLDRYGNAVGIVSAIQTLSEDYPFIPFVEPKAPATDEGSLEPPTGTREKQPSQGQPAPPAEKPAPNEGPAEEPQNEAPIEKPKRRAKAPTLMVLHEATPARAALHLIERTNEAAGKQEAAATTTGAAAPAEN